MKLHGGTSTTSLNKTVQLSAPNGHSAFTHAFPMQDSFGLAFVELQDGACISALWLPVWVKVVHASHEHGANTLRNVAKARRIGWR